MRGNQWLTEWKILFLMRCPFSLTFGRDKASSRVAGYLRATDAANEDDMIGMMKMVEMIETTDT